MLEGVEGWLTAHTWVAWMLVGFSALMFFGTLIGLPWIVASLPRDFFVHGGRGTPRWAGRHPVLRWSVRIVKSVVGAVLVCAGLAMLALPGQGLLTIAVGLMLLEFPGKHRLVVWIGRRRRIRRGLDWLRHKMGAESFDQTDGA